MLQKSTALPDLGAAQKLFALPGEVAGGGPGKTIEAGTMGAQRCTREGEDAQPGQPGLQAPTKALVDRTHRRFKPVFFSGHHAIGEIAAMQHGSPPSGPPHHGQTQRVQPFQRKLLRKFLTRTQR